MALICKTHLTIAQQTKNKKPNEIAMCCPVKDCSSKFTHMEGVSLVIGSRKVDEFGFFIKEELKD
jgi:hypothetical protein